MSRLKRLPTFSYIGPVQDFLRFCTYQRRALFVSGDAVNNTLLQIRQAATKQRFALLAYCFMPDHVHLLVEATDDASDLRRFVSEAKQHSGFAYGRTHHERLLQDGYYDRVLRQSEDARWVARYLLANPVRAGLVESPREYSFLGSDRWTWTRRALTSPWTRRSLTTPRADLGIQVEEAVGPDFCGQGRRGILW